MANQPHQRVRDDSDALLQALEDLKRMEKAKRETNIPTPPFHELADEVEDQARHVFQVAAEETTDGNRAPTTNVSANEIRPSDRSH